MNTSFILWHNDPIFQKISKNEKFLQEYRPALNYSKDYAAWYLNHTYGMTVRESCFSFDNEGKYNLFLLKFN